METWKGRPEITGSDHPNTILKALRNSTEVWSREHTHEQTRFFNHHAQNGAEAIQGGFGILDEDIDPFNPDGKAILYMSMDDLEYTMVGYGVKLLEDDPQSNLKEIAEIDAVLGAIDKVRKQK